MPELPDITIYVEALRSRVVGNKLVKVHVMSPFVLRTVSPPLSDFIEKRCIGVDRIGKRVVMEFEGELFIILHLMIAGRLLWRDEPDFGMRPGGKLGLAAFGFDNGHLLMTEASTKKRAAVSTAQGRSALAAIDPGGGNVLDMPLRAFANVLRTQNRTLKRALTDPSWFSGIGNAYSDEILHAARLSPLRQTKAMTDDEISTLFNASKKTLTRWVAILQEQFGDRFPGQGQITAFRPEFAVHGKFGQPCPVCGKPVQRIRYAENETNYCAQCQNEGRVLADRSLSRLLKDDWPRNIDDWE